MSAVRRCQGVQGTSAREEIKLLECFTGDGKGAFVENEDGVGIALHGFGYRYPSWGSG